MFGGQVATIDRVDGLAAPGEFSGQDLAIHLLDECRKLGVTVIESHAAQFDASDRIRVTDEDGKTYAPNAVIVATGARLRRLGVPGEDRLTGRGVSQCATCDGPLFRGKDVVVIGGGDSAVQEAFNLTRSCREVTMVCRGPMRAKRHYIERLASRENVRFVWNHTVEEILGEQVVDGVRIRRPDGHAEDIACAGVFRYIGVQPDAGFLPPGLRDADGYIVVDADTRTGDSRVFAAGAVRAGFGGDINQAMADGVSAAIMACRDGNG
jgi:thioredoxin reductase (NADPH)